MSDSHVPIRIEGKLGSHFQYCGGCERVSLRFGNVMLPLTLERLEEFIGFLGQTCERHFSQQADRELRFRFSEVVLFFSQAEAEALLDVAQQGYTEVCRQRLEKVFGLGSKV